MLSDAISSFLHKLDRRVFGRRGAWYASRIWRYRVDAWRRRQWHITTIDAVLRLLELKCFLPESLVALEVFGRNGLWKTVDYASKCAYLEFYEIDPGHARMARRALPNAVIVVADSVDAILTGKVRRRDYNFVLVDSFPEVFGQGYCEHFELFGALFDKLADRAVIVLNVFLDLRRCGFTEITDELVRRRRQFYETPDDASAICLDYAAVEAVYRKKIPAQFRLLHLFPVAHPGETIFIVLCLERVRVAGNTG
jgi:hypothetical protein